MLPSDGCFLAVALLTTHGCFPPCYLEYRGWVPLPADSASLDCAVTLQGPSQSATFECPSPITHPVAPGADDCVAPSGLKVRSMYVYRECTSCDGALSPTPQDTFAIVIDPYDGGGDGYGNAMNLKSWLGGNTFSVTVSCGGSTVAQLQDQSFGQRCSN